MRRARKVMRAKLAVETLRGCKVASFILIAQVINYVSKHYKGVKFVKIGKTHKSRKSHNSRKIHNSCL